MGYSIDRVVFLFIIQSDIGSEDCIGRALWALGATVQLAPEDGVRRLAREMFDRAMTRSLEFGPRGQALSLMGLAALLQSDADNAMARVTFDTLAADLCRRYEEESDDR